MKCSPLGSSFFGEIALDLEMLVSDALNARQALVKVMLRLARLYHIVLGLTRDSSDEAVKIAFRRLVVKVHPGFGGITEHNTTQIRTPLWKKFL